jgi:helix-turn-helix protein
MDNHDQERLYDELEALKVLRLKTRNTLWRMRKRGEIGFYRVGDRVLYGESHLKEFLEKCERRAKQEAIAA